MSEDLEIVDLLVKGSNNAVTTDHESDIPLVVRGISKKKIIKHCESINRDYYYIDTGYVGNFPSDGNPNGKKMWHRIVKNDMQHCTIKARPADRWNNLLKQDPRLKWTGWKNHNKKILLVLPNPKACNFYDIDCTTWIDNTVAEIKKYTNLPIEIREKGSRVYRNKEYTIYDAFDSGVYATVCFNSIAALESIMYGIPAFIQVPCVASPLANTDLSKLMNPFLPSEDLITQQCYNLAYGQFTTDEMVNGTAWKILQR